MTLLEKLQGLAETKPFGPMPDFLRGTNDWGLALAELARDAKAEIERLTGPRLIPPMLLSIESTIPAKSNDVTLRRAWVNSAMMLIADVLKEEADGDAATALTGLCLLYIQGRQHIEGKRPMTKEVSDEISRRAT